MSSEKSLTPQIRFKGFTEAWEQRKLGELMEVTSVRRVHQDEWTTQGVRFLRARDLVAYANNTEIELPLYISRELYEKYTAQSGKVEIGDLLVTGVGTIGVPWLVETPSPVYFKDGNIIWFKNKNAIYGKYFYYAFTSAFIQNFIKESAGTGTVGTYTIDTGKKTPIYIPPTFEQHKIASAMKRFDSLITLHQRKLDALKKIKSALLEKMFPKDGSNIPEIRFTGFTEAWEQRKLGDLSKILGGFAWSSKEYTPKGEFLVITISNVTGDYFIDDSIGNRINLEKESNYILASGDILISLTGNVGRVSKMGSSKGVLNQRVAKIIPSKKIEIEFLFQLMRDTKFELKMIESGQGAAQKNISNNNILSYSTNIPNISEQKRIGHTFKKIDSLITLHQRKLDALKKIKSALLEKMFV